MSNILLNVNGIEVIYNHVILVLKGVSLQVPEGGVVALLGGNGAGKTTTLRAVSNLLAGERGEVTKGSIELRGERIEKLSTSDMVKRGVIQVMEGRHCFAHLTIEDNLMTGAYTRKDGKAAVAQTLEKVYNYFPRLKTRRTSQAAYTSGGEQQMCAIGRALMANPKMVLLDEPSMGLAPQIVEEVFEIVQGPEPAREGDLPAGRAEHQHGAALRRLRLHPRERPHRDGRRGQGAARERGREGVLPRHGRRRPQELQGREELQAPQALAGVTHPRSAFGAPRSRGAHACGARQSRIRGGRSINSTHTDDRRSELRSAPFKPDEALQRLKRDLRELGLAEREGVFERRGLAIARVRVDGAQLAAAIVKRPSRAGPQWQTRTLASSAAVRDFSADLKKACRNGATAMTEAFDALETRDPAEREAALMRALPAQIAAAQAHRRLRRDPARRRCRVPSARAARWRSCR